MVLCAWKKKKVGLVHVHSFLNFTCFWHWRKAAQKKVRGETQNKNSEFWEILQPLPFGLPLSCLGREEPSERLKSVPLSTTEANPKTKKPPQTPCDVSEDSPAERSVSDTAYQ